MRKSTLKRARRAVELMKEGLSLTEASAGAGIDPRTLKKALKKLNIRRVKRRGKHYIIDEYYKDRIDRFIYYMMGGYSASRSAKLAHTTLSTMKRMKVEINNKKRKVITKKKDEHRWKLNVYKLNGFHTVFFGRLMTRFGNTVTGSWDDDDEINAEELDDDYANILWQIDFDPFTTSMIADDVCRFYKQRVMKLLRDFFLRPVGVDNSDVESKVRKMCRTRPEYMSEKMLKIDLGGVESIARGATPTGVKVTRLEAIFGQAQITFDDNAKCGVDKRDVEEEYMSPTEFKKTKNRKRTDIGKFIVQVRRKNVTHYYPSKPMPIPFKHDIVAERKLPRRSMRFD